MSAETMDGLSLMFWVLLGVLALLAAAGGIEWLMSRPDRRWLKRLHQQERARIEWSARCIENQCFYRSDK